MGKPFNDQPVDVLVKELFNEGNQVLDLRLKYIGDEGVEFLIVLE